MKECEFIELNNGITNTSEAKIGKKIYYKCKKCGGIIPSRPDSSIGCQCGNIEIDKEMHRLWVGEYDKILILQKK